MDIKPRDFRAAAQGPDPEELAQQVHAILDEPTTDLASEADVLARAHALINSALN